MFKLFYAHILPQFLICCWAIMGLKLLLYGLVIETGAIVVFMIACIFYVLRCPLRLLLLCFVAIVGVFQKVFIFFGPHDVQTAFKPPYNCPQMNTT